MLFGPTRAPAYGPPTTVPYPMNYGDGDCYRDQDSCPYKYEICGTCKDGVRCCEKW
jgi:hypothetical protein